ncbi:scm-like with four MBT domains protein 1 isoform X2 [Mizuhopecten yessoensis]|uniref:scm-like with four MBT domains protein 1 isoform X2 n=1 Tax=Mizuhopecten yessoensis TaxID=6573 RepID=UPI000B45A129|nr:scm-like with four MBT domains protein 1 isoform X2 [Mizuhopecten yessoensis]
MQNHPSQNAMQNPSNHSGQNNTGMLNQTGQNMVQNHPGQHGSRPVSSPLQLPHSPLLSPNPGVASFYQQLSPGGTVRGPMTVQSPIPGGQIPHLVPSGAFRQPMGQAMQQIISPTTPISMGMPLNSNIFHVTMAGQSPVFATSQQGMTQFQPIFLNGQQATIINSVPGSPGGIGILGTTQNSGIPTGLFTAGPTPGGPNTLQTLQHQPIQYLNAPISPASHGIPSRPGSFPGTDTEMPTDLSKKTPSTSKCNTPDMPPILVPVTQSSFKPNTPVTVTAKPVVETSKKDPKTKETSAGDSTTKKTASNVPSETKESKGDKPSSQNSTKYDKIDTADYTADGVPVEYAEPEFVWEEYLQETGASAVPPTAFKHVECSLESGFVKGMKLEVPNKCHTDTYWVASVIMTCGPLLRLRYDGYEEDTSADFWCDLMTSEIHPIGWCAQNNQILQPPEAIKDKFEDWREFLVKSLTGARTAPSYLLDKMTGITPIDQLKQGMRLELQHPINPMEIWLVKIIENVGGRLYLRFEGADTAANDFWLFYLNHRLHPIGWAKSNAYRYNPPKELFSEHSEQEWMQILEKALQESENMILPLAIFKDQVEIVHHTFQKGWKLEALNPITRNQICPATVVDILDKKYFLVELDDLQSVDPHFRIRFSCYSDSKCIFPANWCHYKGLKLTPPKGWPKMDFNWNEYLEYNRAKAAPESCFNLDKPDHQFERGMKLEAVNSENPNQICAATITKIVEPLVWIHLDNSARVVASHIEHVDSHNLFPVGWCESNGYQLKPPRKTGLKGRPQKRVAVVPPGLPDNLTDEAYTQLKNGDSAGNAWCPKIYYNHQCFSGPYLSKGRIALLPKCVGPGPISLVMKEVLSMLINVAYKSCRVLRELQVEGKINPNMMQQSLKAKYKGKSYRAMVEICRTTDQLDEFCRSVCIKLECCPNLISPNFVNGSCPESCAQLTKTKYTYYYGKKKKKLGRPPGGHTNLEHGPKKPGKRGRRRKIRLLHLNEAPLGMLPTLEKEEENGDDDKDSIASDTRTVDSSGTNDSTEKIIKRKSGKYSNKRKYTHHLPPPSEIKTRGAKMPKYSFERRTHKKILITPGSSPVKSLNHGKGQSSKLMHSHSKAIKEEKKEPKEILRLESNPLNWTVSEVVKFIKTTDCAHLCRLFKDQEIDGQALLLLTLPTVQEHLELKLGPAIKLCHQIEKVKIAFYDQYAK